VPLRSLTDADASEIKRRLWDGETQVTISKLMNVPPNTISRIYSGMIYGNIQWPDGSDGRHPQYTHGGVGRGRNRSGGIHGAIERGAHESADRIRTLLIEHSGDIDTRASASSLTQDTLDALIVRANQMYEGDLLRACKGSGKEAVDDRPLLLPSPNAQDWDIVRGIEGADIWTSCISDAEGMTREGSALRSAISIVLMVIPRGDWPLEVTDRLVMQLSEDIITRLGTDTRGKNNP
jgi:hypothetical protein